MIFLLFLILLSLCSFIFIQYRKHHQANKLYNQAKELEKKDTKSPYDITKLSQAIKLYKQCRQLVNKPEFVKAANQCQKKIGDRLRFKNLVSEGIKKAKSNYFREALHNFTQAKKLFITKELEDEISKCQQSIEQQENYEKILEQSAQIAIKGQFQEAIDLLKPALDEFSREDGQQLLTKLERVIQAKELFSSGLIVEKAGDLNQAQAQYEQALNLLPEFDECRIRLGILAVRHKPKQAIFCLESIEAEQAAYIRGFAYAQLRNWQQANKEWRSISKVSIEIIQRPILKRLAERDRLLTLREIEKYIDKGLPLLAQSASLKFIEKFGSDPTIQTNLEEHIQPSLDRKMWNDRDWRIIAIKTEKIWLEQQDINSLHNWAIATYYQAQIDSSKLADFIIAWSTALANIDSNPTLQNIPWLGSNSIDIKDISAKLKQILENAIDVVKDEDIEEYLKLRDIYRRDMVTLSLIKQNNCGMRIKQQLFVLPGCYQRFRNYLPRINFPAEVWGALYTDWGLAVAACLEGDTAHAIKIKPYKNLTSEADNFAYCFVSYHEGCHYLQNLEWRKAVQPLQQAKLEIKAKSDWRKEIDRLCEAQRQKLDEFDKHLQFSKFWYELLVSQQSKSYFAECKARKIGQQLAKEEISPQNALSKLREIQNIDPNNYVVLDLINRLQMAQEIERIYKLMEENRFEEAVRIAKRSSHERIHFMVAETCLEILLKGVESRSLPVEAMLKLGNWAYELCPHEPAFRPLYRELKIGSYF